MIGPGGKKLAATVSCHVHHWNEGNVSRRECTIELRAEGFDIQSTAFDFFEAFCGIRDQLAAQDLYPLCYGASRCVYPSGMLRDTGAGLCAYKLQLGRPVRSEEIIGIFATGPDVEVATVAAQRAFWLEWSKACVSPVAPQG
jgi:hypothetical protein